jgi:hypothetical protein
MKNVSMNVFLYLLTQVYMLLQSVLDATVNTKIW